MCALPGLSYFHTSRSIRAAALADGAILRLCRSLHDRPTASQGNDQNMGQISVEIAASPGHVSLAINSLKAACWPRQQMQN